ncbi:MAG: cyclic nucleotide-binding domain-containing protein [Cyclobacteriaceae bacterium]
MKNIKKPTRISDLDSLFSAGEKVSLHFGAVFTEQFARADYFYLLIDGQVSFHLTVTDEEQQILVGYSNTDRTPIGWSGLNSPKRYATTVKVSSARASFMRWDYDDLLSILNADEHLFIEFLKMTCDRASFLIREAILLLSKYSPNLADTSFNNGPEEFQHTSKPEDEDIQLFLRRSPFFEIFDEPALEAIANCIARRQYLNGDTIYEQGKTSEGMFILVSGKVAFTYEDSQSEHINFRELSSTGFVVGWSSILGAKSLVNAFAIQDTVLYFIPNECIASYIKEDQSFTKTFYFRLMWLIGNQLQAIRARLISLKFDKEIIAIRNLIDQNTTKLALHSPVHQLPHLLKDKLTIQSGLQLLDNLKKNGNSVEKNIADNAISELSEVKKEARFYKGLVDLYEKVVDSGDLPFVKVRKITARKSIELFEPIPHVIKGMELLPESGGNIFIYNHLRNHPYNTLPNNFQITLDSHFISSMILHKKYGDPGIRIVRIGRGAEYGHQDYYGNQGHIDVYTSESDVKNNHKKDLEAKRQAFYNEAGDHLSKGLNLLMSPEGTSFSTEESPGPFKSGAFRLALGCDPEPYIIPISIAHFDRRIRRNVVSCVIHEPFKVSEFISDPSDKTQMSAFLSRYQHEFKIYVDEATKLAGIPRATH